MPEPGMGGKAEQDGWGGRDGPEGGWGGKYNDPYGSSRNTPYGPQSALEGLKQLGLPGALMGLINDPNMPKSLSIPGEGGYDTRDGGGGGFGGNQGLMNLWRQYLGNQQQQQQQGFQFMNPQSQSFMPQIAPPSFMGGAPGMGGPPGNVEQLYQMYGAGPQGVMPGSSPPQQQPQQQMPPQQTPQQWSPMGDWLLNRRA